MMQSRFDRGCDLAIAAMQCQFGRLGDKDDEHQVAHGSSCFAAYRPYAALINLPHKLVNGSIADADEVNGYFNVCRQCCEC